MKTTTVILTTKPKKGKPVSYTAILKAIRTVNARYAKLKAEAETVLKENANKHSIVATKFKYQQFISDLNGIDPKAHENDPHIAIKKVRDWLFTNSPDALILSSKLIIGEYSDFLTKLNAIVSEVHLNAEELHMTDYRRMVRTFINEKLHTS